MTVDDMNQRPENSNYGPPNGYIPMFMNNGSWRDSSHAWVQPQLPHTNSWKPPDNSVSTMSIPQPVSECVILDQDPHQMGMECPPPPPPPFIPSSFNQPPPQFNSVHDFYFFNPPPNQNSYLPPPQSVSESSNTATSSPPTNPNEEIDMSISSESGKHTPENLNDALPFENRTEEYVVENQEQEESYRVYEGESVAAQILNCPEPYIPQEMSSVKRQNERRERYRNRSRTPRRRDSLSPVRRSREKRHESSRRRKDSDRVEERRKSRERSSSIRRKRSPSPSRSRRHDDRHVSSKYPSDRRKEKSPPRHSHHSRRSASPKRSNRTRSSRRRGESVNRENDRQQTANAVHVKETPNIIDQQLQAFAQEAGDPDAMLKKLKQKMMEKLKKTVMDVQPEDTVSEKESTENTRSIRLYYDTQSTEEKNVDPNGEEGEYVITKNGGESGESDDSVNEEEIYPWYRNAPIQHLIGTNFLKMTETEFSSRPQKQDDENGIFRTFPKRTKIFIPDNNLSPRSNKQPSINLKENIVKAAGSGFIVRRNGACSWVSKTLMTNADAANINASQSQNKGSNSTVNGQRITPDPNECYEHFKTKSCQAGALCKYNHSGHNEHQKIKFCQKYLNGLCRDGDSCSKGSHALLPHQIPVCGYYLRSSCPYPKGCSFLHVKNSAKTPLCIHFNKGKCLAEFPCVFTHRYCPTLINARSYNGNEQERHMTEDESTKTNFNDIPRLQWF